MPAKNDAVSTPLHLLQQLSGNLVQHLEKACSKALKDAESLLAKLEKERGKAQDKLHKAQARQDEAMSAGKPKALARAQVRIGELEALLTLIQTRQSDTLGYIATLRRDAEQSLELAQGIRDVERAAHQALEERAAGVDGSAQSRATGSKGGRRSAASGTRARNSSSRTRATAAKPA